MQSIKGCPACEWARRRGELRRMTAEGCPICDGPMDHGNMIQDIEQGLALLEADDIDETDTRLLRVALRDLIATLPTV